MISEDIIKDLIKNLRYVHQINTYPKKVGGYCHQCVRDCFGFADYYQYYFQEIIFDNMGLDINHRISVLGLPIDSDTIEWYIIDPTYAQFFNKRKFKGYMEKYYPDLTEELTQNGYLKYTSGNLLAVFDGFINSGSFKQAEDIEQVYVNIVNICKKLENTNKVHSKIRKM